MVGRYAGLYIFVKLITAQSRRMTIDRFAVCLSGPYLCEDFGVAVNNPRIIHHFAKIPDVIPAAAGPVFR